MILDICVHKSHNSSDEEIDMSCCGVCGGQKTEQANEQNKNKEQEHGKDQEQAQKSAQQQEQNKK